MRLALLPLLLSLCATPLGLAQSACVPTETTDSRIVLSWPSIAQRIVVAWPDPEAPPEPFALAAYRLQRVGDSPAMLPPLAPEAVTMTDTVVPGAHAWQLRVQYVREADGAVFLSDLTPMGDPPPCVVVLATLPPPPTLTGVSPASTLTGVAGMHVRWDLEGADRPVRIERRAGTDTALPWVHTASSPGGFWFDLHQLEGGKTYCYRACLLNTETPQCSAERCGLFPAVP
jgi:hypothetical protein